ncbi:hypothetical protein ACTD5D_00315 [Nocardia takedensis]|uniref:hypothetical protein n=1 Tax=Nocardia takedensis TaxID=259390 RepID=UPI003F768D6B
MSITDDPHDPRLTRGADSEPVDQAPAYLVLSEHERARGFVRPLRRTYVHDTCRSSTTMAEEIAATYATDPGFYGSTYCVRCRMHRPVGPDGEFTWEDGSRVGT